MKTLPTTTQRMASALNVKAATLIGIYFDFGYEFIIKYRNAALLRSSDQRRVYRFARALINSPVFWAWWCLEFEAGDRAFMRSDYTGLESYLWFQKNRLRVPPSYVIDQVTINGHHEATNATLSE